MEKIVLPVCNARVFTLPNGLELIVEEDHSAAVASVQAWVKTGSIHEGRWIGAGLSHYLEHLLFKGTETRKAHDFSRAVQDKGGYINAYTSFDRTVYWVDIPSRGASTALEMLSDALMNSTLPADEVVKEQEVIRREFAMGFDDPDSVSGKQMFATVFSAHPMRHPVIGHLDLFNQITRDDLVDYYQTRYAPNNIFFVVVGDVDADAIYAEVAAYFEKHPRRLLPDVFFPDEPVQLGRRENHMEFPTELTRLGLAWHVPGVTHADLPALDVLAVVLGGGRSSRLYRRLREDEGLVHGISAWCYTSATTGVFGMDAMLDPQLRETVQTRLLEMIKEIAVDGPAETELEKAKRQFLSHQINALSTMRGKAGDLGSNWLYARSLNFTHDYFAAVQQVNPSEIKRVAVKYFTDANLTITSLNPEGSLAKAGASAAGGKKEDIVKFELSNGLRVLVREDERLPMVSMVATFKGGLLAETDESNGLSRLFARTLLKGTKTRTADQIADTIEAAGGGIGAESGNNSFGANVKVLKPDFALGLDLLSDVLLNPTFPEKVIGREKEVMLAGIKADDEEITSVARNLLRAKLFDGHPFGLRGLGRAEAILAISRQDLLDYQKRIICAKNGVLAVFGAVKAEEIKAQLEAAFAAMPAGSPLFETITKVSFPGADLEVRQAMPKTQAVLMVGFPGVDVFSPDREALELIDEACSDLGSRLFNRIREEMGLAYFVGSSNLMGLAPGAFTFYLGTDPAKLGEVRTALDDEIARLAEGGLNEEELARAKAKILGAQDIRTQSNDALAHSCALDELYGFGHTHYLGEKERVEAVTLEQIREVTQRIFSATRVTAIVGPGL